MNIFRALKNLYTGENKIALHCSIFALSGMLAVAFVNVISVFLGSSIYSVFITPKDNELIVYTLTCIMIIFFFAGYNYKYVNSLFKDINSSLPSISMDCFVIFSKIFFISFTWGIYFLIFCILASVVFGITITKLIFTCILSPFIIPFTVLIYILFSQDFKFRKYLFNPILVFKIIKKTFIPVILILIQLLILFCILYICFNYIYRYAFGLKNRFLQLNIILFATCISGYIQEILNLACLRELTVIVKDKLIKQS